MEEMYLHVDLDNTVAVGLYNSAGYEQLPAYDEASRPLQSSFPALNAERTPRNRFYRKLLASGRVSDAAIPVMQSRASTAGDVAESQLEETSAAILARGLV